MTFLKGLCDAVYATIRIVVTALLLMMVAVIFYQIVLRYAFSSATIWAEEFARYAFIWIVLLGSANALRRFRHIRIDFLVNMFQPRIQTAIDMFNMVLITGFLVVLLVYGIGLVDRTGHQISTGLGITMGWVYWSVPVSAALMLLFCAEHILNTVLARPQAATGRADQ